MAVTKFESVVSQLYTNPKKSLNDLDVVARRDANRQRKLQIGQDRANGLTASGDMAFRDVTSKHAP